MDKVGLGKLEEKKKICQSQKKKAPTTNFDKFIITKYKAFWHDFYFKCIKTETKNDYFFLLFGDISQGEIWDDCQMGDLLIFFGGG